MIELDCKIMLTKTKQGKCRTTSSTKITSTTGRDFENHGFEDVDLDESQTEASFGNVIRSHVTKGSSNKTLLVQIVRQIKNV